VNIKLKLKGRKLADGLSASIFQNRYHELCDEYGVYIAAALDEDGDPHVLIFEGTRPELTGEQTTTPIGEIESI
jgi:hypothetical protein